MITMATLPSFLHAKEGNGLLLSHLQQLRQWQQNQQDTLRSVQKQQLEEIHSEQQKIKDILYNPLSRPTGSKVDKPAVKVISTTNNQSKGITLQNQLPSVTTRKDHTGTSNINKQTEHCLEQDKNITTKQKGPFTFLKRGEGIARFKGKSVHCRKKQVHLPEKSDEKLAEVDKSNSQPKNVSKAYTKNTIKDYKAKQLAQENPRELEPKVEIYFPKSVQREISPTKANKEKEVDELVEFEILEQVTKNCSFNSDSSMMRNLVNKPTPNEIVAKESPDVPIFQVPRSSILRPDTEKGVKEINYLSPSSSVQNFNNNDDRQSNNSDDTLCDISTDSDIEELVELKQFCSEVIKDVAAEHPMMEAEKWKQIGSMEWSVDTPLDSSIASENGDNEEVPKLQEEQKHSEVTHVQQGSERSILQERLKELENEIIAFRRENKCLEQLKCQQIEMIGLTKKERNDFKIEQEKEKVKFEEYMIEERKKLKKQQMVFENYQNAKKNFPDKKEREEIAELKYEVQKLQEHLKKQKVQMSAEAGRLRSQIIALEKDKESMKIEMIRLRDEKSQLLTSIKSLKSQPPINKSHPKRTVVSRFKIAKPPNQKGPDQMELIENEKINTKLKSVDDIMESIGTALEKAQDVRSNKEPIINDQASKTKSVRFNLNADSSCVQQDKPEKHSEGTCRFQMINHFDKIEKVYVNGEREFIYNSGTRKIINEDNSSTTIYFYNGDILMMLPDKTEIYHFMDSGVKQTRYSDGTLLIEFPHGQEEKHQKDGSKEILLEDGTLHIFKPDGSQEITSKDGSVLRIASDGSKILEFRNGEKEIQTDDFKRREYNDGTVKIIYSDGKQETRYNDGRLRIKDKDNNVLVDSKYK